ncbi:MAG: sugar phosphate isomerase/epimerase [Chloroflexi bacterium HGW-Chloroflexi-4]|jgi:D-psicose/D-tagatose/L-ribulose 3-epimerase|nr:MAG: sugar phosphate isomerase/epimerase [Chloroflexi bacterium HGW-Chloroflexi-4]
MNFGINSFVWVSPCTTEAIKELAPKVKAMGYDVFEISVENPSLIDVQTAKQILDQNGLQSVICGAFGPERNICSSDPTIREKAKTYIKWLIDAAEGVGASVVSGPMYSSVGKDHYESAEDRKAEWALAVAGIAEMADYAAAKNIKLAFEPLNRFETDMINVVSQGMQFIEDVGRKNVGFHLDTFHMHLEEKDSAKAILMAGDRIFHFHACENDRGVPGTGQVRWNEVGKALKAAKYTGPVVIESFTSQVKEIARAVCIWREIAPSQDAIAIQGLAFLKTIFA